MSTSGDPATLTPAALQRLLDQGTAPRLIDVRTPGEFEAMHIPGSYNVPLDLLRANRDELSAHLDDQVVLVCRSGQRATQAQQALAAAGLADLRVLSGGLIAWQAGAGAVTTGAPRWELERQVRLVAGSIVLTSVLASTALPQLKWVAAFIGAGLTFAAVSNTCTMGMMLSKLPYNQGPRTNVKGVVSSLASVAR